ncbi:MAG: glycosyltransferase [Mangrovicoccus sp.]
MLKSLGVVTDEDIEAALAVQREQQAPLGALLQARLGFSDAVLSDALAAQWDSHKIDLAEEAPDQSMIRKIGLEACLADKCVPWRRIGAATVIATSDPAQFWTERETYEAIFGPIQIAVCTQDALEKCLARIFRPELQAQAETCVPPQYSCRLWRGGAFQIVAGSVCLGLFGLAVSAPIIALTLLTLIVSFSLLCVAGLKLTALLNFHRSGQAGAEVIALHNDQDDTHGTRLPVISILVPLYKEEHIAEHLVKRVSALDYPAALLDICLVIEADDEVTQNCLSRTELPEYMRVIAVPPGSVKTKPRAMNYALNFCRGSIIGIYYAEDAPAPDQLKKIAHRFNTAGPQVACLQGYLDFYNTPRNWMSRCFTLEYAAWFRVLLPGYERLGLALPLGGTTVFFRRHVLEEVGAWDAWNVTEDADLGIRLARHGYITEVIHTTTHEEANCRPWVWVKQRSRWLKGYAMTYAVHMRHPRQLWQDLGAWRFFGIQVMFLGTLTQFTLAPILWSLWILNFGPFHPMAPVISGWPVWLLSLLFISSELVGAGLILTALYRSNRVNLWGWILTLPIYFVFATAACYKALWEMLHQPFYWDKTTHGAFGGTEEAQAAPEAVEKVA